MTAVPPLEQTSPADTKGPGSAIVGALLATQPRLTNIERQAFRAQFTLAQCDAVGLLADPRAVLRQALRWVHPIERTLARRPLLVRRYGRARFAWLLECTRDLGEALQIRQGDRTPGEPHGRRERVRRAAVRMREELLDALRVLAANDPDELERLRAAGGDDGGEDLGASLHALARLAEDWMDREGPVTRALVASVDLTHADVESARAAAHAVVEGGRGVEPHNDLRATGRTEGRVLLEMRLVMRFFDRAHQWDPRVPRLQAEPDTRVALEE